MEDLIDSRVVAVTAETSVEDACDVSQQCLAISHLDIAAHSYQTLLSENILCLAVKSPECVDSSIPAYVGLFDVCHTLLTLSLSC